MGIFIKVKHWFQKANETDGILDVSSEQVKLQVNIIDLTEYVLKLINILERQLNPRSRELLMPFIKILQVPELKGIITVHSTVGRLRKTLITHMLSLFNGVIDDDFVKLRTKWRRLIIVLAYSPGGIHPVFKM
ncbi:protoglobin domain-containing protein [Peribacillus frigoritolerans]|nr:protoglobin domain-containing protein [Peribacillus frigoritolerans]MED4693937.1 protoglobin domain-containing protein [Peribacillus frigoritolerans]